LSGSWHQALDFNRAARNVHLEFTGDWYRDPWSWPEIAWVVAGDHALLLDRLEADGVHRVAKLEVPKENFGTRPAVVIPPLDRLVYQSLVDVASRSLIDGLPWWAYGWRLPRTAHEAGDYSPNSTEWRLYRNSLSQLAGRYSCGLVTDVVSFFASIPTERICEDAAATAGGRIGSRLAAMLRGWSEIPGRSGLPQRSSASAVLANRYLRPLDDTLEAISRRAAPSAKGATCLRWMDDVWIFGSDRGELRRGQVEIEGVVRDLGLDLGSGKTKVLEGASLVEAARSIEHSAVDVGLEEAPVDLEPLHTLLSRIALDPESAPHSSIRFAARRIRDKKLWREADPLIRVAWQMPHGADHIGRLLRDSGKWQGLTDWYLDYVSSPWGCFDWSIGQLGGMFPGSGEIPGAITQYFASVIPQHRELPLAAFAAHRLAAWRPNEARPVLRDAAKAAADPLERRCLVLALLQAGERRPLVRALLAEFPENRVTLRMLEDRGYRPLPVAADYV